MRRLFAAGFIIGLFGLLTAVGYGDSFQLNDGQTLSGELLAATANDGGVQIRVGDGKYERVPWANFSQEDLKKFAQDRKMEPFVEPFIEVTQEEKIRKTEVVIKDVPRLERPASSSVLGAFFGSSVGRFALLLIWAASIYAGYEVAVFRAQPAAMVCVVSAVLPVIGPVIFLSIPTKVKRFEENLEAKPEAGPEAGAVVNPMLDPTVEHPTGLRVAHEEAQPATPGRQATTTYQRGQFTFNRRFFETKFPGFFGVIRRDADRDMVLVIKSVRGLYTGHRITRIAANDLHLEVQRGHASEEVMIPFQEIQEIQLKHKDAQGF